MARAGRSFPLSTQSGQTLMESPALATFNLSLPNVDPAIDLEVSAGMQFNITLPHLLAEFDLINSTPLTVTFAINLPSLLADFSGVVQNTPVASGGKAGSRRRRR